MKTPETMEDRIAAAVEARLRPLLDTIKAAAEAQPPPPPPPPPDDERFLTIAEAAKLFGCHRTTILRFEHKGLVPPRRKAAGRTGWLASELKEALRTLPTNKRPRPAADCGRRAS